MNLCLISRFFDLRNAGIGRYSSVLYDGLKNKGLNIEIVTQDGGLPLGQGRLKYLFFTSIELAFKTPKHCDIYHALSPMESLWLNNKKNTVVTFYDLIPIHYNQELTTSFSDSVIKKISKFNFTKACEKAIQCDRIISISNQTANDLNDYFGVDLDKIEIIRPAISEDLVPEPKNENSGVYRIGTISNLEPRKRIEILINSFQEANIENSELLIAGKGPLLESLKQIAKNDDRIKFLGFVPDEELNNFYNSLDVFVFPSLLEGYGIPIIEAMACKIPVITLEDAIIPSDIKNRTFISEKSDLANVLESKSFKCDLKNNMGFAKTHSPSTMIEQSLKVYNNLYND